MGTTTIVSIRDEMHHAYLDYAMSVIIGRALPDVRDGLKPVHRRVLYAMHELGNQYNKAYKKSARVVGDVIGKYHPHGDSAVYDALVRMAQDFSMRHPIVDGQGNFGSVDGDPPAAMRYTEVRMARIADELISSIEKNTVDFVPNYDDSLKEPVVLPTSIPNLLINGSSGIAVGMATNIPPHNLTETIDAAIYLIENPKASVAELMNFVPGPDFPTGAIIYGTGGLKQAYETGRGVIKVRGRSTVEEMKSGRERIVINEIPYQVNKAVLIERIADLVRNKDLQGISDIRDESDRHGMRIVIDLRKDAMADIILNQLYKHTALQSSFGINLLAICNGQPRTLSLREMLHHFLEHRKEVVRRRSQFELDKARTRFNVVAALLLAIDFIDRVIEIIRSSKDPTSARHALMEEPFVLGNALNELLVRAQDAAMPFGPNFEKGENIHLNQEQAQAILDLRLHRLTGLEREKLEKEGIELSDVMLYLMGILREEAKLLEVITNELVEIKARYGEKRRTEITAKSVDLTVEDLIPDEMMVVTLSHAGYIKRNSPQLYRSQRRGGRGSTGMNTRDEDFVNRLFTASTHDYVMVFTTKGRCYWLKVHEIPEGSRQARGKALVNLIQIPKEDSVAAVLPVEGFSEDSFIVMATSKGIVKKTSLMAFSNPRASGIVATGLAGDDFLIGAEISNGKSDILLTTALGKSIRFTEEEVRSMGRTAVGVRGINLQEHDHVIAMQIVANDDMRLLSISENGYGKQTPISEYRAQRRGGQGIITMKINDRNGSLASTLAVAPDDDIMIITDSGITIRMSVNDIASIGRNTQGVRLINVDSESKVVAAAIVADKNEADEKQNEKLN